jgi:putative tryptophan/tyrosine transport system substrate-binding protein
VEHAYANLFLQEVRAATETFKIDVSPIPVEKDAEVGGSLAALAQQPDSGLIALPDSFTIKRRDHVIAQVARHRIQAVYTLRPFALSGGLISYGVDLAHPWHQAAFVRHCPAGHSLRHSSPLYPIVRIESKNNE